MGNTTNLIIDCIFFFSSINCALRPHLFSMYGILFFLAAVILLGEFPALDADPLTCWLVEEVGSPRSIRQTPVLLVFGDSTGLTPEPPVTPEPGTLVFYLSGEKLLWSTGQFTDEG